MADQKQGSPPVATIVLLVSTVQVVMTVQGAEHTALEWRSCSTSICAAVFLLVDAVSALRSSASSRTFALYYCTCASRILLARAQWHRRGTSRRVFSLPS